MSFPLTLDDFTPKTDNTDDVMAIDVNELQTAIEALEAKVGADSSAVTTSHDYKISQLESGKQDALGFTPENVVNKRTSFQATPTDIAYPSEKLVKDSLDGKVDKTTFDANTILKATTDNTPVALTVGEQTVVGRATGGEISALAIDSDLSSVSANDDTIPSAKATKAYADSKVEDSITDGHTSVAPSGNAVFDALALKAPLASPTFTGTVETPAIKITTGAGSGKVLTSDADGDATWETPSSGGTSLWTAITGTRASNTTITVSGDQTAIFKKGMIVRWQESGVDKVAYVSIPSTYSSPDTTITICGNTCASIDSGTFKYSSILDIEQFARQFAYAGTIGATGTDIMNAYYAPEPMLVLGAEIYVGTVASTSGNTVVDINKNGTTLFTNKPTIAYNALTVATPFAADSGASLALNDRVSIDIDTVTSTTFPVDLYVSLKIFPSRFLNLS